MFALMLLASCGGAPTNTTTEPVSDTTQPAITTSVTIEVWEGEVIDEDSVVLEVQPTDTTSL